MKMSSQTIRIAAIISLIILIFLITSFRVEKSYYFEYPSFLACQELRIYGIRIYISKKRTPLSDFIEEQKIDIKAKKNTIFNVHQKIITIKGLERGSGGIGKDLSKLCYLIDKKPISDEKILNIINLLSEEKFTEFQREAYSLLYEWGI